MNNGVNKAIAAGCYSVCVSRSQVGQHAVNASITVTVLFLKLEHMLVVNLSKRL